MRVPVGVATVFAVDEVNEMVRGKGVLLQRFKDGGLADARVFRKADGLSWLDSAGRTFTLSWSEIKDWAGARASRPHRAQGLPAVELLRAGILSDEPASRAARSHSAHARRLRHEVPWLGIGIRLKKHDKKS